MTVLYLGIDPSRWKGAQPLLHYPVIRTELIPHIPKIPPEITHLLFTSRSAVQHWDQLDSRNLMRCASFLKQKIAPHFSFFSLCPLCSLCLCGEFLKSYTYPEANQLQGMCRTLKIHHRDTEKKKKNEGRFSASENSHIASGLFSLEGKHLLAIGEATAQLLREKGGMPLVATNSTQEGMIELLETLDLTGAYILWPRSTLSRDLLEVYLKKRKLRYLAIDLYQTIFQCPEPIPSLDSIDEIVFTSPSTVEAFLQIYKELPQDKKLTAIGPITRKALLFKKH